MAMPRRGANGRFLKRGAPKRKKASSRRAAPKRKKASSRRAAPKRRAARAAPRRAAPKRRKSRKRAATGRVYRPRIRGRRLTQRQKKHFAKRGVARKSRIGSGYALNKPRRRRRRSSNPGYYYSGGPKLRNGRRRRRSRNPGIQGIMGRFKELATLDTWMQAGQIGLGLGAAIYGGHAAARLHPMLGRGWYSIGASGVAAGLASGIAYMVSPRAGRNVLMGGALGVGIRALIRLQPGIASYFIPREALVSAAAPAAASASNVDGMGAYYSPNAHDNPAMSSEELVAGESAHQGLLGGGALQDWVELEGMGQGGAHDAIPYEDVGGMGDWFEYADGSQPAQMQFAPGPEGF